jgi:hypothetical protein
MCVLIFPYYRVFVNLLTSLICWSLIFITRDEGEGEGESDVDNEDIDSYENNLDLKY